jgi:hypothetical protein
MLQKHFVQLKNFMRSVHGVHKIKYILGRSFLPDGLRACFIFVTIDQSAMMLCIEAVQYSVPRNSEPTY